jgi:hypothetical protein
VGNSFVMICRHRRAVLTIILFALSLRIVWRSPIIRIIRIMNAHFLTEQTPRVRRYYRHRLRSQESVAARDLVFQASYSTLPSLYVVREQSLPLHPPPPPAVRCSIVGHGHTTQAQYTPVRKAKSCVDPMGATIQRWNSAVWTITLFVLILHPVHMCQALSLGLIRVIFAHLHVDRTAQVPWVYRRR